MSAKCNNAQIVLSKDFKSVEAAGQAPSPSSDSTEVILGISLINNGVFRLFLIIGSNACAIEKHQSNTDREYHSHGNTALRTEFAAVQPIKTVVK